MDNQSKEEKLSVIATHIRNLSSDKYKAELSLLSEKALTIQYPETISSLESAISSYSSKILALQEQYRTIELE